MSNTDCQRHRFACVEFISVVRGENDIYRRSSEPSGFIAKKSLVHIAVFKVVFNFLSDLPDPIKQSGSVFSKWDLNTFWTQLASFKRSHTKLQTSFGACKYLIINLHLINEVSCGFVQNHAIHLLIIRESLVQAQVGPPIAKAKWRKVLKISGFQNFSFLSATAKSGKMRHFALD